MKHPSALAQLPDWSAVPSNSVEDCRLLNHRIAYFGAVMGLLSLGFLSFNALVSVLTTSNSLAFYTAGDALHAAATAVFGLTWLACRQGKRSAPELNSIDVGGLAVSLALFGWKGAIETGGFQQATVTSMTSLATIVTHAIIVPATARRAFWVSLLASLPATVAAYFICRRLAADAPHPSAWLPLLGTFYIALWSALTVAVATLAARVIYGLRARAREAREIGQYTLLARLGAGGMGVVYLARHSLLRRPTALKLLPLERAGERSVRRFEREVQLTSALTHPNTVSIYDFGRTPDGIFYYVMEYLDGITLEDLVRHGGALPPARVVHLLVQLCGALVEAHALGLVHRDIKPANLMLCVRGRVSDQLKVLDFGLVKELDAGADASVTNTNGLVGTPSYMAPEAILGPATVTASADLYSVGAVAYSMLVGEPPFGGETVLEVCLKQVHETPARLSSRAPQPIPPRLEALVLACLAKTPSERPASAGALLVELDEIARGLPWRPADADAWWQTAAGEVIARSRARQVGSAAVPGLATLAIDWAARHEDTVAARNTAARG